MCKSNLSLIGTALRMYSDDYSGHYPSSLGMLTPRYLHVLPTCPIAGAVTYKYIHTRDPDCYTVWCNGSYHTATTHPNFPQYDAVDGLRER